MKNNRKLSEALWSDCETDMERFQFLMSGRAFETGIIAKAIQNEVALAFNYRAQMMAYKSSPNVPVDLLRQDFIAGERYSDGMSDDSFERWVRNVREQSAPSEMRGFTADEAESYSESLKKLGKSTGRTFQQSAPTEPKHCGKPHPYLRQACIPGIWQCDECKNQKQSAPSVGSVPTVDAKGLVDDWLLSHPFQVLRSKRIKEDLITRIDALLTSRTEGK